MSSLSIRGMNRTLDELERIRDIHLASLPKTDAPIYYWHFERRNGQGWKFQRDFIGSARAAGVLFQREFGEGYRMRRVASYNETRTHGLEQHHVDQIAQSIAQII